LGKKGLALMNIVCSKCFVLYDECEISWNELTHDNICVHCADENNDE
jgi:hypothetical protein